MAELSFPWSSVGGDRKISDSDFAELIDCISGNGVIKAYQGKETMFNAFTTTPGTGMSLTVATGNALANGIYYSKNTVSTIAVVGSNGNYARIDRLVVRFDATAGVRSVSLVLLQGAAAATPVAPTPSRSWSTLYDLSICTILIPAGSSSILAGNITDTRSDESVCGYASNDVAQALVTPRKISLDGDVEGDVYFDGHEDVVIDASVISAPKLSTARKIALSGEATGEVYFDGSIDVTIPTTVRKTAAVGSGSANSQGWYKVATGVLDAYDNVNILFAVTSTNYDIASGILEVKVRSDNSVLTCNSLCWLARKSFAVGSAILSISGTTWTLYSYRNCVQYGRNMFEIISQSGGERKNPTTYTLADNFIVESVTPTGTVSSDGFTANAANKLTTPRLINGVAFDGQADIDILGQFGLGDYSKNISSTDLHAITKGGKYVGQNVINAPSAGWFYFDIDAHYLASRSVDAKSLSDGTGFRKNLVSGTWSPWVEIATVNSTVARANAANKLTTPRLINGVAFDGSTDIVTYESGVFIPTLYHGETSIATGSGRYTRSGKMVHFSISISGTCPSTAAALSFRGLPFSTDVSTQPTSSEYNISAAISGPLYYANGTTTFPNADVLLSASGSSVNVVNYEGMGVTAKNDIVAKISGTYKIA